MQIIELGAGVHRLPKITQPTHLVSMASWDTVLEPFNSGGHAVVSEAPLRMSGPFQVRHGRTGVKCYEALEVSNLWVHSNTRHGISVTKGVRVHKSLIEYNGNQRQYKHGIYAGDGDAWVSNCIITHNSGIAFSTTGQKPTYNITLDQNLIAGVRSIWFTNISPEQLSLTRNTIVGEICAKIGNLSSEDHVIPADNVVVGTSHQNNEFVDAKRRLWWPKADIGEVGAYNFNANMTTVDHAKAKWHGGWMYDPEDEQHTQPCPLFPGDPI